jgi:hypothetical protein
MTRAELLAHCDVRTALIVDDVYDLVPTAADIGSGNEAWPNFSDDLSVDERTLISVAYPAATTKSFDELITDDSYVAALWQLRHELGDVVAPLFEIYDTEQAADAQYVQQARERLEGLGLTVRTAGRDFATAAAEVDLILIDLFFGKMQDPDAISASKKRLHAALQPRAENPPLVILMSRSPRLEKKSDEFRDEVGLLDSAFRILMKSDIEEGGRLELQLERLAQNRKDSRKLAFFFNALHAGLASAAERTLQHLRKLRLSDIGQIQELLLSAEGQPVGSYLVDVFDRVLQHEIEREAGIIKAALALNTFSAAKYPPPYVAGSPDLQELVQRLVTQNENRLDLPGTVGGNVGFGDVLRMQIKAELEPQQHALLGDYTPDNVLLVLTPACDLQRGAAPRILLLVGSIKPLTAKDWTYRDDAQTPAIRIDDRLHRVKWDLKHVDTVSPAQLEQALAAKDIQIVARLRESHALELQQRLLAGLGRVGQMAALPGTFPVDLDVYYVSTDGLPCRLVVDNLENGAVCFAGRDEKGDQVLRLVLTEAYCDGIHSALAGIGEDEVAKVALKAFQHVRSTLDLRIMMAQGFDLKGLKPDKWKGIPTQSGADKNVPNMGLIGRNLAAPDQKLDNSYLHMAGVIFHIRDVVCAGAPALGDDIHSELVVPPPPLQGDTAADQRDQLGEAKAACVCSEGPTKPV